MGGTDSAKVPGSSQAVLCWKILSLAVPYLNSILGLSGVCGEQAVSGSELLHYIRNSRFQAGPIPELLHFIK